MRLYLSVAFGGFLGAIARASSSQFLPGEGTPFPIGTFIINLIGCFFLSYLIHLPSFQKRWPLYIRTGITTGFIGSFTTFSTLSVESLQLLQHNQWEVMASYLLLSVLGGFIFVHFGLLMASKRNQQGNERENQS